MSVSDATLTKLQKVETAMLREIVRVCEKERIRYFLIGGSALGAVRHGGFIPWDDDIDIGMPRPDYEKFLSLAPKELPRDLFLQTPETDPDYPLTFAKVRKTDTSFIETKYAHLRMNHGVYVDLFPLDGASKHPLAQKIDAWLFTIHREAILLKLGVKRRIFPKIVPSLVYAIFPLKYLREKIEKLMRKYDYGESGLVHNWNGRWGRRETVPLGFFGEGCPIRFEGLEVRIPADHDGYLRSLYGDYIALPPEEERKSPHLPENMDLEHSYAKQKGNDHEKNFDLRHL